MTLLIPRAGNLCDTVKQMYGKLRNHEKGTRIVSFVFDWQIYALHNDALCGPDIKL